LIGVALAACAAFALSACDTPPAEHNTGSSAGAGRSAGIGPAPSAGLKDDTSKGPEVKDDTSKGPEFKDARFPVDTVTTIAARRTFRSPSGNIGCYLDSTIAHCDVAHRDWKHLPPRPASCDPARGTDWGDGVEVRGQHAGAVACSSDSALGTVNPVLQYGRAVRAGSMRCVYAKAGARCENLATGHGFTAAAAGYSLF
jgi:hypothetical protein